MFNNPKFDYPVVWIILRGDIDSILMVWKHIQSDTNPLNIWSALTIYYSPNRIKNIYVYKRQYLISGISLILITVQSFIH